MLLPGISHIVEDYQKQQKLMIGGSFQIDIIMIKNLQYNYMALLRSLRPENS